ncbi:MAG: hypothetical protein PW843_10405 [Azospirillaceae bacterium]|nr:hypothetical protein [Azospirillaceae bacterium]
MIEAQFGLSLQYDTGFQPSVALNANGLVIEVHQSEGASSDLWSRVGRVEGLSVIWSGAKHFDEGKPPVCALNNNGIAIEVHETNSPFSSALWYHVGYANADGLEWGGSHKYQDGAQPAVAVNDGGEVVEVHKSQSNSGLWYLVGKVANGGITFGSSVHFGDGREPKVAMNNRGGVVVVYRDANGDGLHYSVGTLRNGTLSLGPARSYDAGALPAVALTDDGVVVEAHESQSLNGVWQRTGRIVGDSIEWAGGATQFDNGAQMSVAASGTRAIQVHRAELAGRSLWSSVCLLVDRANWMRDNRSTVGQRRLRDVVTSASHDAGMFDGGLAGRTQDLSLYGQMNYGVRYFDLRPKLFLGDFYIAHGIVLGPLFARVLDDTAQFMREGHQELVILKISHYDSFDDTVYKNFTKLVEEKLGPWLVKDLPGPLRDQTVADLTANGGRVLVLCDGDYPVNTDTKRPGFWVYRDWQSETADKGDLVVFDQYSDTTSFSGMQSDQFKKFNEYTGRTKSGDHVCDMFLLSWTLTPVTDVWAFSKEANRNLDFSLRSLTIPNGHGQIVNLIYVDYVQYSRATDVAILLNQKVRV